MLTRLQVRLIEERTRNMAYRWVDIVLQVTTLHPRLVQMMALSRRLSAMDARTEAVNNALMRIRRYQRDISMMAMIMQGLYFLNDG
jgi:hypothetical protein